MVNGLQLPALLVELVEDGRWERPIDISVLAEITEAKRPEYFIFDDFDGMIEETDGNIYLWNEGYGDTYSLTSSSDPDTATDSARLNVDLAVLIAGNWNEEVICLDYRESQDQPKVVCGTWPDPQKPCRWKVIAPSFDAFADRLGL